MVILNPELLENFIPNIANFIYKMTVKDLNPTIVL